jgi:hypothetical protein
MADLTVLLGIHPPFLSVVRFHPYSTNMSETLISRIKGQPEALGSCVCVAAASQFFTISGLREPRARYVSIHLVGRRAFKIRR